MSAVFSDDGEHRYWLDREVDAVPRSGLTVCSIGVNPSMAGAEVNDPTIRKDMGFARVHGWRHLIKVNKFSAVATDVRELRRLAQPIGPLADIHLYIAMSAADVILTCWGPLEKLPPQLRTRWRDIADMAARVGKPMWCLGTTKSGHPRHTLMTSYDTPLTLWTPPCRAPFSLPLRADRRAVG